MKLPTARGRRALLLATSILAAYKSAPTWAADNYAERTDVQAYVDELVDKHHFKRQELLELFGRAQRQQPVLDAIARPAEQELTWARYRPIFVTEARAKAGAIFWQENAGAIKAIEQSYGVPAEIIVAIIGVETFYGNSKGKYPVFDSLITLGFDGETRTGFFRRELEEFLLLARDERFNPFSAIGSYAGAMGIPQFIASSYREYAVDFDGDGRRNLFTDPVDALGSVANYFKRHGWKEQQPIAMPVTLTKKKAAELATGRSRSGLKPQLTVTELKKAGVRIHERLHADTLAVLLEFDGDNGKEYWLGLQNFYVITRYNISSMYAMAAFQLSALIRQQFDALPPASTETETASDAAAN